MRTVLPASRESVGLTGAITVLTAGEFCVYDMLGQKCAGNLSASIGESVIEKLGVKCSLSVGAGAPGSELDSSADREPY